MVCPKAALMVLYLAYQMVVAMVVVMAVKRVDMTVAL